MATSPTVRTLKNLRDKGYVCQIVEKWNQWAHIRIDLFGCIDIVAIKEGENGVLGVQCTSSTNTATRFKKMIVIPEIKIWLKCGNRLLVQGWGKNSKGKWILKEKEITLKDFK